MSDDYFFDDDIVLDADALAILDAEESKYFGTTANVQSNPRPAPTQPTPRPAKRRRTDDDGGWKRPTPEIGGGSGKLVPQNPKRSDSFYEDLPSISLAGDGVYGVYSQGSQLPQNPSDTRNVQNQLGQGSQPAPAPIERTSSFNQNRPPQQRTFIPPPNVPYNPNNPNRPQPYQLPKRYQPPHPQQQVRGQGPKAGPITPQPNATQNVGLGRNPNFPRQQHEARQFAPAPAQSVQSRPSNFAVDKDLQEEVVRLRAQLELVRGLGNSTFPSNPLLNCFFHWYR